MATAFRPCGDYYSTGQDEWLCDDCGADQFTCACEDDEPELCAGCGIDAEQPCDCDDLSLAPVTRISPTRIGA